MAIATGRHTNTPRSSRAIKIDADCLGFVLVGIP